MELTAIFESWHIGDGNYPPLRRGQLVNLVFEFESGGLSAASPETSWHHFGNAEYRVQAEVIWRSQLFSTPVAVLDAGEFRFYVHGPAASSLARGAWVGGSGTLLLDHYLWSENLRSLQEPPNLFYPLRVQRIRQVQIPERFISRHARGKALPTRVAPSDYSTDHVREIETMEGQRFDEEFYIIDFTTTGVGDASIPHTFCQ